MAYDRAMRAMVLERLGQPLKLIERSTPEPGPGEVRLKIAACGVCRTDLHLIDGELKDFRIPIIPGHEIVGVIEAAGPGVEAARIGERAGVGWLGHTCGVCEFCASARENLCIAPLFTGATRDGGYASHVLAEAAYVYPLGELAENDAYAAPLLCAGLIGWRALLFTGEAKRLGIYGFGAAGHIIAQAAIAEGREIFAFVRPGDEAGAAFARSLGAAWAGASDVAPPEPLDAAIIFAPVGDLVPAALRAVKKGASVVLGGISMSDIPAFPYEILWGERRLVSVANLTRADARNFLAGPAAAVQTRVTTYPLEAANEALFDLRAGRFEGAAVLIP
ncbi:MAG: zinc-dependent alcohol dehydrogenase family protein [Caulobacteraceae bacterium]